MRYFGDGNEDGIVDGHKKNMSNVLGSEDFGILATAIGKPYAFWFWGGNGSGGLG